ncbi:MAG: iron-containing alcohol dehydrogenase [Deltaproteobacteria bacterium]|nr:iron-containing alcohol dehydrogenase [Deltaproteobacteria bacterium]
MSGFELAAPGRIAFGPGVAAQAGPALAALGAKRILLVTGKSARHADGFRTSLKLPAVSYAIFGEPTLAMVTEGRALARSEQCDAVVALGGGSAIDAGKAIAALARNDNDLLDYMEVVGKAMPLPRPGLPCIAIPTTAGTGAEVTKNSVLASPEERVKASLRSPHLLPVLALIDPDLLDGIPQTILARTGLDALSHLVESFVSIRANPFTLGLGREGMARIARSLRPAFEHGLTPERREDLAVASLFGGLCLANSGLGAVHGFAAPLGGMWKAPHGAVCAALLPPVMAANVAALSQRAPQSPSLARYREVDRLLADGGDAPRWVADLVAALAIPKLASMGVKREEVSLLVEKAKAASSMRGNPIVLADEELTAIVKSTME